MRYLPPQEVADFTIEGKLEVTCQFCNSVETFTEEEVASLVRDLKNERPAERPLAPAAVR